MRTNLTFGAVVVFHVLSQCAAVKNTEVRYTASASGLLKIPTKLSDTYEISNRTTSLGRVTPFGYKVMSPFVIVQENGTRTISLQENQCFDFQLKTVTPVGFSHAKETTVNYLCQPEDNQRTRIITGCSVAVFLVFLGVLGLWWKFGKPSASRPDRWNNLNNV